jgi:hypothetical protein
MNRQITLLNTVSTFHVIADIVLDDAGNGGNGQVVITLASGFKILLADAGQDCCETRYLRTNDKLNSLVGETLMNIRVTQKVNVVLDSACNEAHEVEFLEVLTDRDMVTFEAHNEHNGYYGGFLLKATVIDPSGKVAESHSLDT